MSALYTWDDDTERMGLDELPPIEWEPPKFGMIPVGETRELFGKAGWRQWELAVKLQESKQ